MTDEPLKHAGGRPTLFSPEMASAICEEIASGHSLRSICDREEMPAKSSVFLWLSKSKEFSDQYARAMEARTEVLADEILEISDESTGDYVKNADGQEVYNGEAVQRSKLRVDTRKWLMSKMAPKKYGDKITQEVTGSLEIVSKDQKDAAVKAAIRANG